MDCPKCGEPCCRDEVDVGVGVITGPWGCGCGWSEDRYYDCSDGPSPAQLAAPPGRYVDSTGNSHSVDRIVENLKRFKIPERMVRDLFSLEAPRGQATQRDPDGEGGETPAGPAD